MSVIIDYDHEDGTLNEWEANTDATEVTAAAAAALAGTNYGMQVVIDDTTGAYCYRNAINNTSGVVRFRLYIDINSLTMANNDAFAFLFMRDSTPDTFCLMQIRRNNTPAYTVIAGLVDDAGTNNTLESAAITDAPHYIEVKITRATTADANDASLEWWIDDVAQTSITGKDCYNRFGNFNFVGMGAISGLDSGTSGTFYLDQLVINDDGGKIGPVASLVGNLYYRTLLQGV